ncbi:MAG: beta-N-acetylhexosaminidase, partial [Chitinophagaceae bacterium]
MKKLCLLCLLLPVFISAQESNIIPRPVDAKVLNGNFTISPKTVVVITDEGDQPAADFFISYVKQYYSLSLRKAKVASKNFIRLNTLKFIRPGTEGKYQLTCDANGVTISGDTYSGTFYGVQTLIQLLPLKRDKSLLVKIPQCEINDQPRFAYRGLHLDVGRHFMPVDFVKRYIDYIALHKMNYFHWHLTEDQGWRIEIKKYPNLTKVGAWRNGTLIGRYPGTGNDNINYGGYYTQEQVKEIVKYAADRFITVVPEIELPGHSSAAIAAYPYLSCFPDEPTKIPANMISKTSTLRQAQGDKKLVQETWGVFVDVFCAGKDETFTFLQDVMDEVMALFPSKYIHVGGDECPKENWKRCPNCQKRIKDNNLKNEHELQSYFIQRMEKYLNSNGRTLIGWDEILEGGLAAKAVVMSWRGEQGGIDAAKQNHDVIMTPGSHVYLDHSQSENEDSVTIGGYTSVEKIYSYEPIPAALNEEQGKYVLGAQGNVWTEY